MNAGRKKVEDEGNVCRVCGLGPAEAAHTWPRSLGATGFGNADVIVPLCRRCHQDFDGHRLELLPYLNLQEQVALVRAAGGIERARQRVVPNVRPAGA